jgi:hypothetical protein
MKKTITATSQNDRPFCTPRLARAPLINQGLRQFLSILHIWPA